MAETYFLLIVLGLPVIIIVVAVLAGRLHHGYEDGLDWKPTRSPQREAELQLGEVDQMLVALNRYRRLRGAPERSLAEVTERNRASLRFRIDTVSPPDRSDIPSGQ
jgi:hypothetical protein